MFRPNVLQGDPRAASLGALWIGKFEKLPSSKVVDVIWEALDRRHQFPDSSVSFQVNCKHQIRIWFLRPRNFLGLNGRSSCKELC